MNSQRASHLCVCFITPIIVSSINLPTDDGRQYKDGFFERSLNLMKKPNWDSRPVNGKDYCDQIIKIKQSINNGLYTHNQKTFDAVRHWLDAGADPDKLIMYGIEILQLGGTDFYGNLLLSGYFTMEIQARHTKQGKFQYPIYRMPPETEESHLPSRAEIYYNSSLDDSLAIAWSNSLVDNYIMEVQGRGYVDFGDGEPPKLFVYGGDNEHDPVSIGKVLIDRGILPPEDMNLKVIKNLPSKYNEREILALLAQNPYFPFFEAQPFSPVIGGYDVPLIAGTSLASDPMLLLGGSTVLVEVPKLDDTFHFNGTYELRVMVVLDIGIPPITGQHLSMYQGFGSAAFETAVHYNHFGRVWQLEVPVQRRWRHEEINETTPVIEEYDYTQ